MHSDILKLLNYIVHYIQRLSCFFGLESRKNAEKS
jgi:hypothetical protein